MQHLKRICELHHITPHKIYPLTGGDINDTYKVSTTQKAFVIKINQAQRLPDFFKIEAQSLNLLSQTHSFKTPRVIAYGEYFNYTYLIINYIEPVSNSGFSENFASALAKLHQNQSDYFGLHFNNYIGRLVQYNQPKIKNAVDFYINLRLKPQFKMAITKGFEFQDLDQFYRNIRNIIPKEKASLIHGDLWNGNYLITKNSQACIFDPAIAYASREMDLAMMKLFGGFPEDIFNRYHEKFPLENGWESRLIIWQLYYILVHLNLFGNLYYPQAKRIVEEYN